MPCKFGINWINIFLTRAKMVNLVDILIVGDKFLKKDTDMLRNNGIKLLCIL